MMTRRKLFVGLLTSMMVLWLVVFQANSEPPELCSPFPLELTSFRAHTSNPIFKSGQDSAWDRQIRERGWVLADGDQWRMYYTGYDGTEEGRRMLGLAISSDGVQWERAFEEPIHNAGWVEDVCVVYDRNQYYLFAEGKPQAHWMTSSDGIHWESQGPLDIRTTKGEPQIEGGATPTVFVEGGTWYLFYQNTGGVWLAKSHGPSVWTNVRDEPVIHAGPEVYDRGKLAADQVIKYGGRYYMYYHGRSERPGPSPQFGTHLAASNDLVSWTKYPGNPVIGNNLSSGIVVDDGSRLRLYTMHDAVRLFWSDPKSADSTLQQIDFESGQFDGVRLSGRNQSVVANPTGTGKVFRAHVPRRDERSEISFGRHIPGDFKWEGQTRFYAWDLYLPADFTPSGRHTILAQWHRWQPGMNDRLSWAKGSPNVFAIDRETGRYHISLSYQNDPDDMSRKARSRFVGDTPEAISYQDDLGRWIHWSAQVRWSASGKGHFVLYRNGRPVVSHEGPNYLNLPEGPYFKCGIYTGDPWDGEPSQTTAFFDNVTINEVTVTPAVKLESAVHVIPNIAYVEGDNPRQQLDLVLPEQPTVSGPLPVVVLIHGGGFRKGSRDGYLGRAKQYAATGRYAAATIGYRLSGEAIWPAQIHDCKAAVRWLKAHAAEYHLDRSRFAAGGGSAGGHLAAMLGVSAGVADMEGKLGKHLDQSSRVACVVERYGPTDLLTMNDAPGKMDHNAPDSPESALIGGPIQEHRQRARSASPTTYVTGDDAAFLILHGEDDMSVPLDQSHRLHRLLREAEVPATLIAFPDAGHGLKGVRGLLDHELEFLDRHLWNDRNQDRQ